MSNFGLTPQGFFLKKQSDIIKEIQASLRTALGTNLNLLPTSIFGQIVGIFSEREALIWEVAEAVYASEYPNGAEGTSFDNILALSGLKRLGARPSISTQQALYGTPGTFIPAGSLISVLGVSTSIFSTDTDATIASAINAIQSVSFTSVPDSGSFQLQITDANSQLLTSATIDYRALAQNSSIFFSQVPTSGQFQITLTRSGVVLTTGNILYTANAAAVQSAIQALGAPYSSVTVTGNFTSGFVINWGSISEPLTTITGNTLMAVGSVVVTPIDSVQAAVNNFFDVPNVVYPYSDVVVSGNYSTGFILNFGAGTPTTGNPSSGAQPQVLISETNNTLQTGLTSVNLIFVDNQDGEPAQAIVSATCTQNGPTFAAAGSLTVINTPVVGWTSTSNLIDATVGANIETDTDGKIRRLNLLGNQGTASLQAIIAAVAKVSGVTQDIGFENVTDTTDGDGRPPHSFEIVALGGADLDVATTIFNEKPAGIQTDGTTTVTVTDPEGFDHLINFSRPTFVPIYVSVTITKNGLFPVAGADLVKEDIVSRGDALKIGQTVILNGTDGLSCAMDQIPGILNFVMTIGTAPNPVGTSNIAMTSKQLATFDTSRVVVTFV